MRNRKSRNAAALTNPSDAKTPTATHKPTALTPVEQAIVIKQQGRQARSPAPALRLQVIGAREVILPAHHNAGAGWLLLMNALGTANPTFVQELIQQLAGIAFAGAVTGKLDDDKMARVNAALSCVEGIAPRDETEAMLAAQMTAIHYATMRAARKLAAATEIPEQEVASNMVSKLARTYAAQVEALKKYRSAGEQVIRVQHQHVTVHEGGQAIVGNVEGRKGGSYVETAEQPHVPAVASSDTMRSEDPQRKLLQGSGDAERALPAARREIARPTKGQQERSQARKIHRRRNR